ncbi:MAG: PTS sugar transporter subunit IIA [Spirochaetales bacterium]|nr:PTS sugar transporter subunit IIA [Spirochaetales bacterium]
MIEHWLKRKDILFLSQNIDDKDSAFRFMIEKAGTFNRSPKNIRMDLFYSFMEREKKSSTNLYNGVAVPHIITPHVQDYLLLFGLSSQGIDFKAIDHTLVFVIFMLFSPENQRDQVLEKSAEIISTVMNITQSKSFIEKLKNCQTEEAVLNLLLKTK